MVDVKSIIKGVITFILGFFFVVISWYIVPILIDTMNETTNNDTTLRAIFYVGLVILYIIALVVAPAMMIMKGSKTEQ